jgi:general stress protein CsbA
LQRPPANDARVSSRLPPRAPRTPWAAFLARTVLLAILAYFLAAFTYLILDEISRLPHDPVFGATFQGPLLFSMLIAVVAALSVPYFQTEWYPGLRTFSLFAGVFLIAFAMFHDTESSFFNPYNPARFVQDHISDALAPFAREAKRDSPFGHP